MQNYNNPQRFYPEATYTPSSNQTEHAGLGRWNWDGMAAQVCAEFVALGTNVTWTDLTVAEASPAEPQQSETDRIWETVKAAARR